MNLEKYWAIIQKNYDDFVRYEYDGIGDPCPGDLLKGEDIEYVKNLYYSYVAYVKKNYENLTLTQDMVDQLDEIKALIAKGDTKYASKFQLDYTRERISLAESEHPVAFGVGRVAGDAALYACLSPLGGSGSVLAQETAGGAAKVFAKNVMIGTAKDFLVKDGPAAIAGLAEGKDYIVVMQDTGEALLYDMAGNVLGEAVNVGIEAAMTTPKADADIKTDYNSESAISKSGINNGLDETSVKAAEVDGSIKKSNPYSYSGKEVESGNIGGGQTTGPYAYLEDGPSVGAGKDFTAAQKQKMLEENMKRNGGVVKSDAPDDYYQELTKPQKSQKGVTPSPDEWQFDHIEPKSKGGKNSYSNCQIVSRKYNREKWDR